MTIVVSSSAVAMRGLERAPGDTAGGPAVPPKDGSVPPPSLGQDPPAGNAAHLPAWPFVVGGAVAVAGAVTGVGLLGLGVRHVVLHAGSWSHLQRGLGIGAVAAAAVGGALLGHHLRTVVEPFVGLLPGSDPAPPPTAGTLPDAPAATGPRPAPSGPVHVPGPGPWWAAHIAQFHGKYLPDGPKMSPDCGPASATTALRLVGLDVPGFHGERDEAVLDAARRIATGSNVDTVGVSNVELEHLLTKAGAAFTETTDVGQVLAWARKGIPTILSGNPMDGWDSRYADKDVFAFDGGHWVTVSGYDPKTKLYVVNDPLAQVGPIEASAEEITAYTEAHGQLGIGVGAKVAPKADHAAPPVQPDAVPANGDDGFATGG